MKLFIKIIVISLCLFNNITSAQSMIKTKTHKYNYKLKNINRERVIRRRITNLERDLIQSKNPRKTRINGRTVISRSIFSCSKSNISQMLKGNAPFGIDGKKVNLHHMKQQQDGELVELTQTEHTQHSKVLHRYNRKNSDIIDRNGDFQRFKKRYWKKQASSCISGRR